MEEARGGAGPAVWPPPAGMDLAAARRCESADPTGVSARLSFTHCTSSWQVYVAQLYDPTLDDITDVSEPEIVRILGEKSESSVQLRDQSSQRFAVRRPDGPTLHTTRLWSGGWGVRFEWHVGAREKREKAIDERARALYLRDPALRAPTLRRDGPHGVEFLPPTPRFPQLLPHHRT